MTESATTILERSERSRLRHPIVPIAAATVIACLVYAALSTGSAGQCREQGRCVEVSFGPSWVAQAVIVAIGVAGMLLARRSLRTPNAGTVTTRTVMARTIIAVLVVAGALALYSSPGWYFGQVSGWQPGQPIVLLPLLNATVTFS